MKKPAWIISGVMLATALLGGCDSVSHQSPSTTTEPTMANQSVSNGSTSNETDNTTLSNNNNFNESMSSQGNTAGSSSTTKSAISATALVKQIIKLAEQGKTIDIPYAVQQNVGVVQKAWGKPDSQNSAGAGIYATYGSHQAAFGFNKGEQIFDVRSYSSKLKTITLANIEAVLGKPGDIRQTSDSVIYMYPAGPDNQLLWVFSKSSSGAAEKTVNHVSVFWPQGTVDIMAATQPAPSIVMDNAPGSVGSLFTFSIQNPPKGYRLVELEWLPKSGTPIIDTYNEAIANGKSGASNPGFSISGDGSTYSFIYPSSMRNQTGTVRVIYQATSGEAMIGNSQSITLK